jgi:hypothetical protein
MTFKLYNKPPHAGGTVQQLTQEELQTKLGFKFQLGMTHDANLAQYQSQMAGYIPPVVLTMLHNIPDLTKQTAAILKTPRADLAIVNLGSEVGDSLMALQDIKKNQVIDIYSGNLRDTKRNMPNTGYDMTYPVTDWEISALAVGSFSRFCPHLPYDRAALREEVYPQLSNPHYLAAIAVSITGLDFPQCLSAVLTSRDMAETIKNQVVDLLDKEEKIDDEYATIQIKTICPESIKRQIATANICIVPIKVDGTWYLALVTIKDIKKNEIMGLSYSKFYWQSRNITPKLLLKNGDLLNEQYYDYAVNAQRNSNHAATLPAFTQTLSHHATLVMNKPQQVFWDIPDHLEISTFSESKIWNKASDFSILLQAVRQKPFVVNGYFGDAFHTTPANILKKSYLERKIHFWPKNTDKNDASANMPACNIVIAGAKEENNEKNISKQLIYYYDLSIPLDSANKRPIFLIEYSTLKEQCLLSQPALSGSGLLSSLQPTSFKK